MREGLQGLEGLAKELGIATSIPVEFQNRQMKGIVA